MANLDITGVKSVDLLSIVGNDTTLKETSRNFYSGPCPFCGGEDRFVLKRDPRTSYYLWFCRGCSDGKYQDAIDYIVRRDGVRFAEAIRILGGKDIASIDPAVYAERERIAAQERETRISELAEHLSKFTESEIWEAFNRRMGPENRAWWRAAGIPDDWQNFWKLGFVPEKRFEYEKTIHTSPAYTIPKFGFDWHPANIDYRLVNPPNPNNKYRPAPGLPPAPFITRPDLSGPTDESYILEGSKKSAVFAIASGIPVETTCFGVPSKNSWAGIVDLVKDCGRVWIILDPDAFEWAAKLAKEIGDRARVIRLPFKADDGILQYGMTPERWESAKKWAVKPADIRL